MCTAQNKSSDFLALQHNAASAGNAAVQAQFSRHFKRLAAIPARRKRRPAPARRRLFIEIKPLARIRRPGGGAVNLAVTASP